MIIHGQYYDGIVGKPDLDDSLEHYGIKGMKWRHRKSLKGKSKGGNKKLRIQARKLDRLKNANPHDERSFKEESKWIKANQNHANSRYAQDIIDGKIKYEDIHWKNDGFGKYTNISKGRHLFERVYKKDVDKILESEKKRKQVSNK